VLPALARRHLVIAPDLLGHGASDKPRADYAAAAYANGIRDLLSVLGIDRVTLVGHSLGGGVAMQFAYQYPDKCERMVLVATGGAGPHVSPVLRAATLPGAPAAMSALRLPGARRAVSLAVMLLRLARTDLGVDAPDLQRMIDVLPDATARSAFLRTLRSVVDWRGQVVTMLDRCYLARGMPTLLVWGSRDSVLPIEHAYQAHAAMPGSRLEVFHGAGHFPFRNEPSRFARLVEEFCAATAGSEWDAEHWRALLRAGRPGAVRSSEPAMYQESLRAASERSAT
jgi:pimeloyl-ACP methyl ester carboxylesterase